MASIKTLFFCFVGFISLLYALFFNYRFPLGSMVYGSHQYKISKFISSKTLYVFGDSTVESNTSLTIHPYGIDMVGAGESGRFSNGKTPAHYLAEYARDIFSPESFVNFASSGCGVLTTTKGIGNCKSLAVQIDQFVASKSNSIAVGNALFFLSVGSNDFIFSLQKKEPKHFVKELVTEYVTCLKLLHLHGANKILISNVGLLGCIPDKRNRKDNKCNENLNQAVHDFNVNLVKALKTFIKDSGAQVMIANSHMMFSLFLEHPTKYGLEITHNPCCGSWTGERFECNKDADICKNRKSYLFFDGAHPTEEANRIFIENCVYGIVCIIM